MFIPSLFERKEKRGEREERRFELSVLNVEFLVLSYECLVRILIKRLLHWVRNDGMIFVFSFEKELQSCKRATFRNGGKLINWRELIVHRVRDCFYCISFW